MSVINNIFPLVNFGLNTYFMYKFNDIQNSFTIIKTMENIDKAKQKIKFEFKFKFGQNITVI